MENVEGLGGLLAFMTGWLIAQSSKFVIDLVRAKGRMTGREAFDCFFKSGGMPSGHTASFSGLTTFFIGQYGIFAPISVLALCMTIIVVYDAVNVRYAVGEQGKALNSIASEKGISARKVKVIEGHTVPQVIVGAVLGISIGVLMAFCF